MPNDPGQLFAACKDVLKDTEFYSLRVTNSREQQLADRHGVLQPPLGRSDCGAMITVHHKGGTGYAATADLTGAGIARTAQTAKRWAEATGDKAITDFSEVSMPAGKGRYNSPVRSPWQEVAIREQMDALREIGATLRNDSRIIDSECRLWNIYEQHWHFNSAGAETTQEFSYVFPSTQVTAEAHGDVQRRTFAADSFCQQGGWELLLKGRFAERAAELPEEALQLTAAPMCPSEDMDILIAPDQMILQIHESIGHPIELDRILGDERNYAGTSFVTLDMFGVYQYGSELLNVLYQPDMVGQVASYAFDDDAQMAKTDYVIKNGILVKPLGGAVSQARAGMGGVANVRAQSWNRPPIDRMANLNVEPGQSSFEEMVAAVERGIYVRTNTSWSIDDSRNKFQFGCEWAQLIEGGKLTKVVKQPNYRGVSSHFWRNLTKVGDVSTQETLGTPFCGKGEPNQVIRVGHASPACLFKNVSVFGGA